MEILIKFLATGLIVLMTLGVFIFFRKKIYSYLLMVLAGYGLQQIIIFLLKILIHVERPYLAAGKTPLVIFPPQDYSFPSGHACFAFFLATLVYLKNKKWGLLFYVLALLVGLGRVLAYVHYPIDIMGGAVLGIGIGYLTYLLMNKLGKLV